MGHGLDGKELEEAYRKAQAEDRPKRRGRREKNPREHQKKGYNSTELPSGADLTVSEGRAPVKEETEGGSSDPSADGREESRMEEPDGQQESILLPEVPTVSERNEGVRGEIKESENRLGRALDRLQKAENRLQIAREKTGEEVQREIPAGGLISRLLGRTKTQKVVERTEAEEKLLKWCREEVEEAQKAFRRVSL